MNNKNLVILTLVLTLCIFVMCSKVKIDIVDRTNAVFKYLMKEDNNAKRNKKKSKYNM